MSFDRKEWLNYSVMTNILWIFLLPFPFLSGAGLSCGLMVMTILVSILTMFVTVTSCCRHWQYCRSWQLKSRSLASRCPSDVTDICCKSNQAWFKWFFLVHDVAGINTHTDCSTTEGIWHAPKSALLLGLLKMLKNKKEK